MITIFTDTSANLPISLIRKYNISLLPFSYTVNGKDLPYADEWETGGKKFYDAMREGAEIKTSMINPDIINSGFRKCLENGDDILYIGMSGGISGTAHSAAMVAEELREEFPERLIATIDTYAASLGEGLLVIRAAEMRDSGISFKDIEACILSERNTMCQYFTVDDLKYLKKGGRISGTAAMIGTLLNIKPILKGDETGHIISCGKVRGKKAALITLAEKYGALAADKKADIGIAHADAPEDAEALVALLKKQGFRGNVLNVCYEPVTGSHVGPGTVALFFPGTEK